METDPLGPNSMSEPKNFILTGFWVRSGAAFIDSLILLFCVYFSLDAANMLAIPQPENLPIYLLILFPLFYHTFAVARYGKTIGQRLAGIAVMGRSASEVGYPRSLARAMIWFMEPFLLFIGSLIGVFTPQKRMLQDYAAGTRVVYLESVTPARKAAMVFLGVCFPLAIVAVFLHLAILRGYPIN
jgi:uncharacterized RDD family membrane protein YckC